MSERVADEIEAALRDSEARYRNLISLMPAAMYVCDRTGRITLYNDQAVELWGRRPTIGDEDHKFCGAFKLFFPDGSSMSHACIPMAESTRMGTRFRNQEVIIERPDGSRRHLLVNIDPLTSEDGNLHGAINVFTDITERKRAEALLVEQSRLMEHIASGRPLDDILTQLCRAVPTLNPGARACIVLANEDRTKISGTITPDLSPVFAEALQDAPISDPCTGTCGEAISSGTSVICADVTTDGRWSKMWRDVCLSCGVLAGYARPILGSDGVPLASFVLCFDQPHQPTEWELNLSACGAHIASIAIERDRAYKARQRDLHDARRLRAISAQLIRENDVQALYERILDAAMGIMQADFSSIQMVEHKPGDGSELKLLGFRGFNAEAAEFWATVGPTAQSTCGVALQTGQQCVVPDVQHCEFMASRADLEVYLHTGIHAVQTTPLLSRSGKLVGMISTHWKAVHRPSERDLRLFDVLARQAADAIERSCAEEALRRLNDELEQRVHERTHELALSEDRLRTLATELNLAEQRERKRLATELHDYLAQLLVLGRLTLSQAKRAGLPLRSGEFVTETEDILNKALTYCRTLMAELSPPILLDQGLPAGLQWLSEYMKKHEMAVTVTVPEHDALEVREDHAVLLFQSVRELLLNASKHAGTGEAAVILEHTAGTLRITVNDHGVGFDPAAAVAGATENTSPLSTKYGLFSIRERMKALGGSFDIRSAPRQGTTATLTLPIGNPKMARDEERATTGEGIAQTAQEVQREQIALLHSTSTASGPSSSRRLSSPSTRIRVLVVDDHPAMRQGLRSIVTAYDHLEVVGEAGDGAEAVELAQRLDPDVVVMDVNMPKMDGIEATRQIKAHQPTIVVIGLSVHQSADVEQKMKAAGAFAYLTKESAIDALCHAIEHAVLDKQQSIAHPV